MKNQQQANLENKQKTKFLLDQLAHAGPGRLDQCLAAAYHPDAHWRGSHPLNEVRGLDAIKSVVWRPLLTSCPDLERRDNILAGGRFAGRDYVAMAGHYAGTFRRDWLDIPATGGAIYLRYGEIHEVKDGRIIQSTVLIDVLNAIRQAGFWPLPPSLGSEEAWPGPISADGILNAEQDPEESAASLELTLAMQESLRNTVVERDALLTMSQVRYWHPRMMWYGPCGIGTSRGLEGFVDVHQRPFRIAFPVRNVGGPNHYCRIGDGKYSVTAGWPSVIADHVGGGWLGLPPSGRKIEMRVMDFYLADDGLVRENWVPIDMIHILLQMDVDIMARVRQQCR